MNISLIGFMGTGKSTVGRKLSQKLGYDFVDLDQEIINKENRTISEIFIRDGEEYFRNLERKVTAEITNDDQQVIATGGGVIIDQENIVNLKRKGIIILLKANPQEILNRISNNKQRPLLQVENPLAEIKRLLALREKKYNCTPYQIDTTNLSVEEVVTKIINII